MMLYLLISVESVSAAVPLSHGGKNPCVGTDHSRMVETDLHMPVKVTRCKLFPSAVAVEFQLTQTDSDQRPCANVLTWCSAPVSWTFLWRIALTLPPTFIRGDFSVTKPKNKKWFDPWHQFSHHRAERLGEQPPLFCCLKKWPSLCLPDITGTVYAEMRSRGLWMTIFQCRKNRRKSQADIAGLTLQYFMPFKAVQ